jgi:hypothetical protein
MPDLVKKTNYPRTISLTPEEAEIVFKMGYDKIEVKSSVGRTIKTLTPEQYSRLMTKMFLREVNDDPTMPAYYVMPIA